MLLATVIHKNGLGGQKLAVATALESFVHIANQPMYLVPVSIHESPFEVKEMLHRLVGGTLVHAQNHTDNMIK